MTAPEPDDPGRPPDRDDAPAAIPAATLILFRDRAGGDAELLFVERARTMAFAPGAITFPGGRLDPGDAALATDLVDAPTDAAHRIAAIRETIEEAGVAAGLVPPPEAGKVAAIRTALSGGMTIGAAIAAQGLWLDLDAIVPFARWRPAHRVSRVFDTRFYLGRASDGADASVDATENVRLFWSTAKDLLAAARAGEAKIIFPTRCNLERLATLPDLAAAVADARAHPVRLISPWIERHDGIATIRIPADVGYPVTSFPAADIARD